MGSVADDVSTAAISPLDRLEITMSATYTYAEQTNRARTQAAFAETAANIAAEAGDRIDAARWARVAKDRRRAAELAAWRATV